MTYIWVEAEQRRAAIAALRVLGEAVATVARARLVGRACDGRLIGSRGCRPCALWDSVEGRWYVYVSGDDPLAVIDSVDPADGAAAAVARLLEGLGYE